MGIGVSFPGRDIGADPNAVRHFAQAAEELGFERLTFVDHVLHAAAVAENDPPWAPAYTVDNCIHEPMTLLAFVAAVTRSIKLVTANVILPQRQTVLVAKQAAEVDVLSEGRLILGIGIGWNQLEYRALESDFENRGQRIEEQVLLMRRLWTERTLTFEGRWHGFDESGLNPQPVQQPIPIWFGAMADPAIRRAGRLGDGWLVFPLIGPDDDAKRKIEVFRSAAADAQRDPAALGIDATVYLKDGDIEGWTKEAEAWSSLGATTVTFRTPDTGNGEIDQHIVAMDRLMSGYAAS